MPEITEIVHSDEEYQDAVCNESAQADPDAAAACVSDPNSAILEDIIKQQGDLHLNHADKQSASCSGDNENLLPEDETLKEKEEMSMTPDELEANKEKANNMKLKANEMFKNNESEQAICIYTEALTICPLKYNKERAVLYGNRAAAKIKSDFKKSALEDCSKAIEIWPDYVRALLRRAKLYELEDELDAALADYKRVYELDPGQNDAREAILRLPPLINERNERLKEEMMGKLKDLGNMILKPFGLSTSNFQMQEDPNTGSYSINFNQNPS